MDRDHVDIAPQLGVLQVEIVDGLDLGVRVQLDGRGGEQRAERCGSAAGLRRAAWNGACIYR